MYTTDAQNSEGQLCFSDDDDIYTPWIKGIVMMRMATTKMVISICRSELWFVFGDCACGDDDEP